MTRQRKHWGASDSRTHVFIVALGAILAAVALALLPAAAAAAHDYVVDSSPKAGATQTTPILNVSLTLNDVVLDLSRGGTSALLQVTGPDDAVRHFETGCPEIDGRVLTVPVALGTAGRYTVTWQIVSADGHTVSDSIAFRYAPPEEAKAVPGSEGRPTCGGSTTAAQALAPAVPSAAPQAAPSAIGVVITIASAVVLLAIIAVVVLIVTARKRTDAP